MSNMGINWKLLHWKIFFFRIQFQNIFEIGCNKEIETREKSSLQYKLIYKHCLACILLIETLPSMYFWVDLKMKKPLLCCFTRILFIELNLTGVFLLIRTIWDDRFAGKVGNGGF